MGGLFCYFLQTSRAKLAENRKIRGNIFINVSGVLPTGVKCMYFLLIKQTMTPIQKSMKNQHSRLKYLADNEK